MRTSSLRSLVNVSRIDPHAIAEVADARAVVRQQVADELLGRVADEPEVPHHAAAPVQHDDDRDGLDVVGEDGQRLRLAVVEDLEVVAREIGDEPAGLILHRRKHGDGIRPCAEAWLLPSTRGDGSGGDRQKRD